ncbi:uncharacterized protein LOC101894606 [Musca domestica]|uniref:Uncharacterized protein LOC101894606 n=1 Tax=Musca domestica TaxID=7370 RepID=A0ABM3VNJ8_MUSDO|nr:uncharacterized protein LOC101894606 [Musca domestica]XP_058987361.1 uncharacterized protein LOC101894606 [Musca domestica]XP_058987362.1 uncharacterized protein LOC101894606 [Musca domestica]XP_058987363.1 uncharacterized protein LOC101894606 [Musca domestica]
MASNMHNTRLLRFLIVVSIVVLTIFIYASYSSTQTLAPPPMRNTAMASLMAFSMANKSSSGAGSNADVFEPVASANVKNNRAAPPYIRYENLPSAGGGGGSHGNDVVVIKKLTHHREPTIDENAIDGGGSDGPGTDVGAAGETGTGGAEDLTLGVGGGVGDDTALDHFNNQNNDLMQEEQYVQAVENNLVNINNSAASAGSGTGAGEMKQQQQQQQQQSPEGQQSQQQQQQQAQQNKISDSDVLIPTSNLQKFIESADKILKNISSQHHVVATADTINKSPDKYYLPLDPNNDDNEILDDNDEAQQPSVIMTIKGGAGDILSNINNKDSEKIADDNKNNNKNEAVKQVASAAISSASAAGAAAAPSSAKTTATTKKAATKVQSADPTQGIPTQQIYEPGHMNEEIDIEQICPNKGDKLKLLILITSAQTHTEARLAIRQTWGHFGTRRDVSTAFILGRTTNATINEALTQENMIYGDLIRGHFIDSYNNLTLKTLSSLEWVDNHCPKAKYILKTDDDMFINVPKLLQFLDAHAKDKRVIYGRLAKKWKPIRNKKSKYYISTGQFNAAVFPPFTTGPAYVLTSDIVHELYVRSLHQVYLKLEDVFTTGIVAQQLGIKRVHVNEFLNRRIAFNPCNIRKSISVHMIKANEQFDLWKKLLDQTTKCK